MNCFYRKVSLITASAVFMMGCSTVTRNLKVTPAEVGMGFVTQTHKDLVSLPEPSEKVVAAVYKFRDQTGQYKASTTSTSFSTAITQGATSILLKALEDSGWFVAVEREGLSNLLNERKIIRSTRMQAGMNEELPAMLYGGVMLDGGVISYDTNLTSGGIGAKYLGIGGSGQVRQDQVTVCLRAVSVQSGQILKTVTTTKSILSRELDLGVYKFVGFQQLLEIETGFSTNEPPSVCVQEAIEKAVHGLIVEGIKDNLWLLKNPEQISNVSIQKYLNPVKAREDQRVSMAQSLKNRKNAREITKGERTNRKTASITTSTVQ